MRANRGRAHEPRALYSIESEQSDKHYERQSSPHSSRRSGSFMENEPTFESQNSDSETEIASVAPQREVVAVVWQNLYMVSVLERELLCCGLVPFMQWSRCILKKSSTSNLLQQASANKNPWQFNAVCGRCR